MKKGLIYRAYNKVTNKSYVGLTTNGLEVRKAAHLSTAKSKPVNRVGAFHRDLKKYPTRDWIWEILEDNIEDKDLDSKEIFYIAAYDCVSSGYNKHTGGRKKGKESKIHSIYHPELGDFKGTLEEVINHINCNRNTLSQLRRGDMKSYRGWVLGKYKDCYKEHIARSVKEYTLYHNSKPPVTGTSFELLQEGIIELGELSKIHSRPYKTKTGYVAEKYKDLDHSLMSSKGRNRLMRIECIYSTTSIEKGSILTDDLGNLAKMLCSDYSLLNTPYTKLECGDYFHSKEGVYKILAKNY